jgi:broad specificity phosphatase PhoE
MDNETRNIILVSHSKRIRSFIYKNFINFEKKLRFRNCAILHIYFDINTQTTLIKLLYAGNTDKNENRNDTSYYTCDSFNNLNIYSNTLIVPENINIFMIRHAQGYHNANNTAFKKFIAYFNTKILKDPQLTDIGINQAKKAGEYLNKYFTEYNLNKKLCITFCSVLLRTRETLNIVLDELKIYDKDIIILPCSNEISSFNEKEYIAFDNHMCKDNDDRNLYKCDYIKGKEIKRNINWTYFNEFKQNYNKTDDVNMIYQTYNILRKIINKN